MQLVMRDSASCVDQLWPVGSTLRGRCAATRYINMHVCFRCHSQVCLPGALSQDQAAAYVQISAANVDARLKKTVAQTLGDIACQIQGRAGLRSTGSRLENRSGRLCRHGGSHTWRAVDRPMRKTCASIFPSLVALDMAVSIWTEIEKRTTVGRTSGPRTVEIRKFPLS